MPTLVLVDDVPAAAQLFPHVGNLLAKGGVLPLQEGGAHRDLVLLQPPGVARALGRLVVLDPPAPVLLILSSAVYVGGVWGGKRGWVGEIKEESGMREVSYVMREERAAKVRKRGRQQLDSQNCSTRKLRFVLD